VVFSFAGFHLISKSKVMWSWWTQWYTRHLFKTDVTYLNEVYHHDLVITLDKLPDIMKQYGKLQNQFQKPIRNSEPPSLITELFYFLFVQN